jgi:hypothetical protein
MKRTETRPGGIVERGVAVHRIRKEQSRDTVMPPDSGDIVDDAERDEAAQPLPIFEDKKD